MSSLLMRGLVVTYLVVAAAYAWERDWARASYFLCATGISVSVQFMK